MGLSTRIKNSLSLFIHIYKFTKVIIQLLLLLLLLLNYFYSLYTYFDSFMIGNIILS